MRDNTLAVRDLTISYVLRGERRRILENVSFNVEAGGAYGLVGESGCGKSTVAHAIVRYLPVNAVVENGSIEVCSRDVLALTERGLQAWRGTEVAMVYQDPATALNPTLRIGVQVAEILRARHRLARPEALSRAQELLEQVSIVDAASVLRRYPHELSGGQQQRVVIAMALAADPALLVLDEPTTGLDATVEAEVLDLIAELRARLNAAILFISHNLALVSQVCGRIGILYSGRIVEEGPSSEVLTDPRHPYTLGLVRCVPTVAIGAQRAKLSPIRGSLPAPGAQLPGCRFEPRCPIAVSQCSAGEPPLLVIGQARLSACFFSDKVAEIPAPAAVLQTTRRRSGRPLLVVEGLQKRFGNARACDDVSFSLHEGEILGVVGESGSGKTTLARCIVGLVQPDAGVIAVNGERVAGRVQGRKRQVLEALQMVFQNPDSTLNPRHTTRRVLSRAVSKLHGERSVDELAREARLEQHHLDVRTVQLSGGLKQRAAIARAFAGRPALVVCDEPVSALDVSVQAAVLNLLADLSSEEGVAYLFISHDLGVVRYLADRIMVMYLGQIVEVGDADDIFGGPQHPYTQALLSAVPTLDPSSRRQRILLSGTRPSPGNLPIGCRFHTRCARAVAGLCAEVPPPWREAGNGHVIRCHIPVEELRVLPVGLNVPEQKLERSS